MRKSSFAVIFIALTVAVGALAYVVRESAPEIVLARAFRRLRDAKAVSMKVTAAAYAPATLVAGDGGPVPVLLGGGVFANIPADALPSGEAGLIVLGSGGGEREDLSIEARVRGDGGAFLKFDGFPLQPDAKAATDDLNGHWFSLQARDLSAMLGGVTDPGPGLGHEQSLLAWQRIRVALVGGELFVYGGKMPNEVVDGAPLRHFALLLESEAAAKLTKDVRSLLSGRELRREEEKAILDGLSGRKAGVEVWIDKRSGTFRKMSVVVGNADGAGSETDDRERKNLIIEFEAFPAAGEIEAPADARPFADVASLLIRRAK